MKIIYVSGGQRSGKSRFAQEQAEAISAHPIYLATARVLDDEFRERVRRHKEDRGEHWHSIEIEKSISLFRAPDKIKDPVIVLDCVTLWLTNLLLDHESDSEKTLSEAKDEWDRFKSKEGTCFVISNEIGMGLVSEHELGRKFTDLQGFLNQYIAAAADEAYFLVSGNPLRIK